MAFYVNTNISAMNTSRQLSMNQGLLATSMQRLSSGLRINSAADDAAGLSIGEALQSQVTGTNTAVQNAQNGISLVQTAEGALNEDQTIVQRVRQLAVQGSNETLSQNDRKAITSELLQLNTEMNRIASATQFNGQTLLSNSANTTDGGTASNTPPVAAIFNLQIGANVNNGATGNTVSTLSGGTVTAGTTDANMVTLQLNDAQTISIGNTAANGGTAASASASAGTAATGSAAVTTVKSLQDAIYAVTNSVNNTTYTATDATQDFQNLVAAADQANVDISSNRSNLGAYQNRLQHTINNLNIISQNLSSAQSSIMNVDMAQETTNLAKYNILQQSGVAMLAQANQNPQAVLKLLG